MHTKPGNDFEHASQNQTEYSVVREIWLFSRHNKKWWLLPILFMLGMFGLMMILSSGGAAPFIYTLF